MKIIYFLTLVLVAQTWNLASQPNKQCEWQDSNSCPLYSFGNMPVCVHTDPVQLSADLYGIKICTSEMFFFGSSYDVRYTLFGVIQSVQVVNEGENSNHCDSGQMSVGSRVFMAHCDASGPSKISGYWAITYKIDNL